MAETLVFGPFRLDLTARELFREGERVDLKPKALDVLAYLASHAGETLTREDLFEALWPGVYVADHALSVQILEIRRALGDDPHAPVFIETRHRRGYRFCAQVSVVTPHPVNAAPHAPRTQYVNTGGVNIAYQVVGDGPIDLVFVMGWISHLDHFWTEPRFARFLARLSAFSRVILFDKRGSGLSDRVPIDELPTIEQRMEDVRAVMDAAGSQRAVLCGISEGGCLSAVSAATDAHRSAGLIMIGSYARRIWAADYPWAPTADHREAFFEQIRSHWGEPVGLEERAPTLAADPDFREWWAGYLRTGASPAAALALTRMNTEVDIRNVLPLIRVPTLILHRTGDRCMKVEEARYMASRIPGARLVELPGDDHLPFVGDQDSILRQIEEFVTTLPHASDAPGLLATVLCCDFEPGAHEVVRRELRRLGSTEPEVGEKFATAGFDGPVRALRCACLLRDVAGFRAGLHTGEVLRQAGRPLSGPAVQVASRLKAQAASGEILATGTLRDLTAGSGIRFHSLGHVAVDGVGEWQLLAVIQATGQANSA